MNTEELRAKAVGSHVHRVVYLMQLQAKDSNSKVEQLEPAFRLAEYHQTGDQLMSLLLGDIEKHGKAIRQSADNQQEYLRRAKKQLSEMEAAGQSCIEQRPALGEDVASFEKDAKAFNRSHLIVQRAWRQAKSILDHKGADHATTRG